ncbi:MAG: ABC transporter substrate-binding protein [Lachnospiraceae bacterium]|nr:ABC transporter substrate-binding protein [Lachnospiraceae bacterium]
MATNAYFPPYEYHRGGELDGIDVAIGKVIAEKMGLELKLNDMEFDEVINSVRNGESDIAISTLTITDERKKLVDFSEPYASGIQSIIVRVDSHITSEDDLANAKKIGVQKDSTGEAYFISNYGDSKVVSYDKVSTSLLDLNSGAIDAIVIDRDVSLKYVEGRMDLNVLETGAIEEEYGIAITKGNDALRDEINAILKEMKQSGELEKIISKYVAPAEE